MKQRIFIAGVLCVCLLGSLISANAETNFPDRMSLNDAVGIALEQIADSPYKDIEVMTTAGSMSGEFVKRSGDILILKRKTGSIHLKSNKEKVSYILIDVKAIVSIAFYQLD